MKKQPYNYSLVIRNFTFGVEDSLVSTVALLTGLAVANTDRSALLVTGLILICVEAFSMAVGSLLSEQSAEEYEAQREVSLFNSSVAALVMFVSFVVSGLIPLVSYFFLSGHRAIIVSIALSLAALIALGIFNAYMNNVRAWRMSLQTVIMGGLAIIVGIVVGQIAGHF